MTRKEEEMRWADCSECGGKRRCDVKGNHTKTDYFDNDLWTAKEWRILQCRGCETVFIQTAATFSEDYTQSAENEYDYSEQLEYWPSRSKRPTPDWFLPGGIEASGNNSRLVASLAELYAALDADLSMLAAIGIRTTFDIACELLEIDGALTFLEKVSELVDGSHITSTEGQRIFTIIDAGSASAHRGWTPTPADLTTMMEVLERFIVQAFVDPFKRRRLDQEVGRMRDTVPPKKPRVKKKDETPPAFKTESFEQGGS